MKTVDWFEQGLIPGLLYFQNGGTHTGSVTDRESKTAKEFRYKIETKEGTIRVIIWYGPFCYEKSEMADQAEFSLDDGGRTEMLGWLKEKYESMIE